MVAVGKLVLGVGVFCEWGYKLAQQWLLGRKFRQPTRKLVRGSVGRAVNTEDLIGAADRYRFGQGGECSVEAWSNFLIVKKEW